MRSTTNALQVLQAGWVTSRAYSADHRRWLRPWAALSYFAVGLVAATATPDQTIWLDHNGGRAVIVAAHPTAVTRTRLPGWATVTLPFLLLAFVALVVLAGLAALLLPAIGGRTDVVAAMVALVVVAGPPLASAVWPVWRRYLEWRALKAWTRELHESNPGATVVKVGQLAAWPKRTGAGVHLLNQLLADRLSNGQVLVGVARDNDVLALYRATTIPAPVSHPNHPHLIRWGGNPAAIEWVPSRQARKP